MVLKVSLSCGGSGLAALKAGLAAFEVCLSCRIFAFIDAMKL